MITIHTYADDRVRSTCDLMKNHLLRIFLHANACRFVTLAFKNTRTLAWLRQMFVKNYEKFHRKRVINLSRLITYYNSETSKIQNVHNLIIYSVENLEAMGDLILAIYIFQTRLKMANVILLLNKGAHCVYTHRSFWYFRHYFRRGFHSCLS